MRERKNVYQLPPEDKTIEWYAKAVAEMKKRPATDPTSWYYQAAIHGFNVLNPYWAGVGQLPPKNEQDVYWKRCQHQSWYFLPWHRMYLAYFEQIVANTVAHLGGPANWALPFWDYSDASNPDRLNIPPAFTSPGDASNPLWMPNRRNTLNAASTSLQNLDILFYTTTPSGITGFGGPVTKFNHGGGYNGGLESLPHNRIHVDIGGAMGDPNTAGLDPIFWLHHANIDRLWQVWLNKKDGRANPDKKDWLDFPFHFHDKDKNPVTMISKDVEDTRGILEGYTYQGVPVEVPKALQESTKSLKAAKQSAEMPLEVVAASDKSYRLGRSTTHISVALSPSKAKASNLKSLAINESVKEKKHMLLRFENIKGNGTAPLYSVYINVPQMDGESEAHYAGSLALFGLQNASTADEHHSGSGLNEQLEVTDLIAELRSMPTWDESKLDIRITPDREVEEGVEVSIGRVSLYSA